MTDKIQSKIENGTALSPVLAVILMILLRAGGLFETPEAEAEPEFIVKNGPSEATWIDRRQMPGRHALNIQTLLNLSQSDNVTFQPDGTMRVNGQVVELGPVEMNSLARFCGIPQAVWDRQPNIGWDMDRPGMPGYCTPSRDGIFTGRRHTGQRGCECGCQRNIQYAGLE